MSDSATVCEELPVWAKDNAFPKSPGGWGWLDFKGNSHSCESTDQLIAAIQNGQGDGVDLIWVPGRDYMILPEELIEATDAILASRLYQAKSDNAASLDKLRLFGCLLAGLSIYIFYQGWSLAPPAKQRVGSAFEAMFNSTSLGISLLLFLIFAFIPWYQSRKRVRELAQWNKGDIASAVPTLRFETWLEYQKAPLTKVLLVLISVVGLAQLLPNDALSACGLLKDRYFHGEYWRLFTAPFLHGNLIHFLMNASALLYLGKRMEVFARWPHLPLVFLFAACIGGEASARFVAAPSVGASGGLMGWLGFLLVFESLHGKLVPRTARRRLTAGVLLTGLIGLIGYRFIDNAAHLGGLLAGMLYALIVFPKSTSALRPRSTITDRIAGSLALAILILSALFAVYRIISYA
ncbi:MAG: rhomboid family intramembrane serine protease [Gloeobacteraceae cyanobacterium ES-bin-144]|nr:rhomboid family intramembrane serine protease [Verrucomicrobiales bacterium]